MDGFALLCDFAEVVNGKLYIMGGGWTEVYKSAPLTFALAAKIDIPYDRTNELLLIEGRLVDVDGHQVSIAGQEIVIGAQVELGRPPGIKKGTPLAMPLAWKFVGLDLPVGSYDFRLTVEAEPVANVPFSVHRPPTGIPGGPPRPEAY